MTNENVPSFIDNEVTGVVRTIAKLEAQVESLKERSMTFERVDAMITGLRKSLETKAVESMDPIEAVMTDIKLLMTKEEFEKKEMELKKAIEENKPPGFYRMVVLAGAVVSVCTGFALSAQSKLNEMHEQMAVITARYEALKATADAQKEDIGGIKRRNERTDR